MRIWNDNPVFGPPGPYEAPSIEALVAAWAERIERWVDVEEQLVQAGQHGLLDPRTYSRAEARAAIQAALVRSLREDRDDGDGNGQR